VCLKPDEQISPIHSPFRCMLTPWPMPTGISTVVHEVHVETAQRICHLHPWTALAAPVRMRSHSSRRAAAAAAGYFCALSLRALSFEHVAPWVRRRTGVEGARAVSAARPRGYAGIHAGRCRSTAAHTRQRPPRKPLADACNRLAVRCQLALTEAMRQRAWLAPNSAPPRASCWRVDARTPLRTPIHCTMIDRGLSSPRRQPTAAHSNCDGGPPRHSTRSRRTLSWCTGDRRSGADDGGGGGRSAPASPLAYGPAPQPRADAQPYRAVSALHREPLRPALRRTGTLVRRDGLAGWTGDESAEPAESARSVPPPGVRSGGGLRQPPGSSDQGPPLQWGSTSKLE